MRQVQREPMHVKTSHKSFIHSLNIDYLRIIEGKGPKIQLKLESFHLERDLVEDDAEAER